MRLLFLNDQGNPIAIPVDRPLKVGKPVKPDDAVQLAQVGRLTDLLTEDHRSLVAAINELCLRFNTPFTEPPVIDDFFVQYLADIECVRLEWSGTGTAFVRIEIFYERIGGQSVFEVNGLRFGSAPNRLHVTIGSVPGDYIVRLTPYNTQPASGTPILRSFTIPNTNFYGDPIDLTAFSANEIDIDENETLGELITRARPNNPVLNLAII